MSKPDYLNVKISCAESYKEILIAELSDLEYDSMMETEIGLEAYIKPLHFKEEEVKKLAQKYPEAEVSFEVEEVITKNWNEEWEKNYDPINVEGKIYVRATFHEPNPDVSYEIIINPRMSFGTGHHSTTYLMLLNQLKTDHNDKRVLDAGTGTGILAVMAEKLGASEVVAYDNNSWSTENVPDNIDLNHCSKIKILEGTIDTLNIKGSFDIILANINKNVLLDEMAKYCDYLNSGGTIIFSGFYESDNVDLIRSAESNGLKIKDKSAKNDWSSLVFIKS